MSKKEYALITGASSGIGEQLAYCFARDDTPLILVARNTKELERVKRAALEEADVNIKIYAADLSLPGAAQELHDWTHSQNLPVRYLVNNAGFGDYAKLVEAETGRLEAMIDLNIKSLVILSKLYGFDMSHSRHGNIVNIASIAGFVPGPGMATYYATKAFVLSFSQALAAELESRNVLVTAVCPAATASKFALAAHAENTPLFKSRKLPSSKEVAKFTYLAMKKGKLVAIWGFNNRVMARLVSLAPRRKLLDAVGRRQG